MAVLHGRRPAHPLDDDDESSLEVSDLGEFFTFAYT